MIPLPPYGWTWRDEPGRSVFVGFDYALMWPLLALMAGPLAGLRAGVLLTGVAGLLAFGRGFRLVIDPAGITVFWTWLRIPSWRKRLPLDVQISAVGGLGDDEGRVVLERDLHMEDVELGSSKTCHALAEALRAAQRRFTP